LSFCEIQDGVGRHLEYQYFAVTFEPFDRFSSNLKRELVKITRTTGNNIQNESKMATTAILNCRHLEFLNSTITFEPLDRFS